MAKKSKTPLKMSVPDKGQDYEKAREEFLSEPKKKIPPETERPREGDGRQTRLPWEEPGVNERVIKSFNLRLSEPDFLKLRFVVNQSSDKSMHAFCARVVMEEVKRQLNRMT